MSQTNNVLGYYGSQPPRWPLVISSPGSHTLGSALPYPNTHTEAGLVHNIINRIRWKCVTSEAVIKDTGVSALVSGITCSGESQASCHEDTQAVP